MKMPTMERYCMTGMHTERRNAVEVRESNKIGIVIG